MKDHLKFKFNSGLGAVLCSNCSKIIMSGGRIPDYIWEHVGPRGTKKIEDLPPMFCCKECEEEYKKKNQCNDNEDNCGQ